jgi:acyl carrier protein
MIPDTPSATPEIRVTGVVVRLLKQRAVTRSVSPVDDLREVGLTSMDMLNLVLAIEAEFDLIIPESGISPANFRSIATISDLVDSLQRSS